MKRQGLVSESVIQHIKQSRREGASGYFRIARWFLTLVMLLAISARAQVEDFIIGTNLNFLTLRDGRLFTKAGCGVAGFSRTLMTVRAVEGAASAVLYNPSACNSNTAIITEMAVHGPYAFWLTEAGVVRRLILGGGFNDITTTPLTGALSVNGQVAASSNFVYWTEEFTEFRDRSIIYRATNSPGATREIVADYSTAESGTWVRSMETRGDNQLIFLLGNGQVVQATRSLLGSPPFQFYAWLRTVITSEATAIFPTTNRLFWADASSDRRSVYFRSAPWTDLSTETLHHWSFRSTAHDVYQFVADGTNLYYQDLTSSSSGPLMRKRLMDDSVAVEVAALSYEATHMALTDRHVIWRKNNTTVSRLPINAAAVTRDLAATGLEVVQVIQNPNNENPLVMGKPTFVRFFAQIASSSAGETNLSPWPIAYLYGEKDGVALEGSPLIPLAAPPVRSRVSFRTSLNDHFFFQLPDSWTRRGVVRLRGVVNPSRVISETSFANNSRQFDANFARKSPICMVMYPVLTHMGAIRSYQPYMQPMFDYIEALLPTSELRLVWHGGLIEEPYDPAHWVGDGGPFEVSDADDDGPTLLMELNTRKAFNTTRYCQSFTGIGGPGGWDHYVGLLRRQPNMPAWSGYARRGDEDVGRTENASTFFLNLDRNGLGVPSAATTQCQELAHNYGRLHVNCGDPDNVDHGYPYPQDTLSSAAAGYIGFDPFRRQLVLRDQAKDYMSYCGPKWTSDYTWKGMFNRIGTLPAGASAAFPARAKTSGPLAGALTPSFLTGVYRTHESMAAFKQVLPLGPTELLAAQQMTNGLLPHATFELRAYADGVLNAIYPIYVREVPADEGAEHSLGFTTIAELDPAVDEIDFVSKQNPGVALGTLVGGGGAPDVEVTAPAPGSVFSRGGSLNIQWTASDPDNDALVFTVRFSADGGSNWLVIISGTPETSAALETAGIPGSTNCIVEVIATDGLLTDSARSQVFSLAPGQPRAFVFVETSRGKKTTTLARAFVPAGEPVTLHGRAFDDEDGEIPGESFTWSVTGPVTRTGSGRQFYLHDLSPGDYAVQLIASDVSKQTGVATMTLTVDPHYVENASAPILLDGHGDDAGYLADERPLPIRYVSGEPALVRMVHRSGKLYVGVSGLRIGTNPSSWVGVSVDVNNNGGTLPASGDLRFDIFADGRLRTLTGNGSSFVQDAVPNGFTANVSANGGFWTAELCIDLARLGGWNGQTVGLAVGQYGIDATGVIELNNRFWPAGATQNSPGTWGDVVFGTDPNDQTDSDGDGLSDQWEIAQFTNLQRDGDDDPDGDGANNSSEFGAATNPLNANSVFKVRIAQSQGGIQLSWPGAADRTFTVFRSEDLINWDPIAHNLTGSGWFEPHDTLDGAFYRVEVSNGR